MARRIDWVVYAKKPFGGPAQVLAYLGRYTHRVAIANNRLAEIDNDHVGFTWKDYRDNDTTKTMKLAPNEFIRRFLLHALPEGFHRIRHFGFMANGHRAAKLALCRSLLADQQEQSDPAASAKTQTRTHVDAPACSECGGVMRIVVEVPRRFHQSRAKAGPFHCDTS